MKKQIILSICIILSLAAQAQQVSSYSHSYLEPLIYNPAFAGDGEQTKIIALASRQWMGSDIAASSALITGGTPLTERMAIGGRFSSDKAGLFSSTGASIILAYHLPLSAESKFSFGMSAGLARTAINTSALNARDADDPLLGSAYLNNTGFESGFGANYQRKRFDLGISFPSILSKTHAFTNLPRDNRKQLIFSTGYKIPLGQFTMEPRVLLRTKNEFQGKLETMLTMHVKESFWVGGLYRFGYGPAFYGGIEIDQSFRFGYAYDLGPGRRVAITSGAHELFLSYHFGNKDK